MCDALLLPSVPMKAHRANKRPDSSNDQAGRNFEDVQPVIPDYELLRIIGSGSYGEVWLARSVLGTYRALKLVYRNAFESPQPYEREFNGIKRFEPVSQQHASQLAVLHVGKREEYFYYVMEIADDIGELSFNPTSGGCEERGPGTPSLDRPLPGHSSSKPSAAISPDSYVPHTLRYDLKIRHCLPLEECLSIGLCLTEALAHLHEKALVHRDIKPSNIIFVDRKPKLADIGLCAGTEDTFSFVGTEGYVAPEGPGKVQADIYSLGKVLYEMSTGQSRLDFPEFPEDWNSEAERNQFLELNEIVLKACASDPSERYQSVREMAGELRLLQEGRSVRKERKRREIAQNSRRIGVGALIVGLFTLAAFQIPEQLKDRAIVAPRQFQVDKAPLSESEHWRQFDIGPDGKNIVLVESGNVYLWDRSTSLTRKLSFPGLEDWVLGTASLPRWSPDGSRIILQGFQGANYREALYRLFLLDLQNGKATPIGPELSFEKRVSDIVWGNEGDFLTYITRNKSIFTMNMSGARSEWVDAPASKSGRIRLGGYSHDDKWLVVSGIYHNNSQVDIWILPHLGGDPIRMTDFQGRDLYPTWHPEGHTVYFVRSGFEATREGALWKIGFDPATRQPKVLPEIVFRKINQSLQHPKFVGQDTELFYVMREDYTRIWIENDGQNNDATIMARGKSPVLSPDGNIVYFIGETPEQQGIFAVDQKNPTTIRKITNLVPLYKAFPGPPYSLSADGKYLAFFSKDKHGFGIFVVPTSGDRARVVAEYDEPESAFPQWAPQENWLAYTQKDGLYRVRADGSDRQLLGKVHQWEGWNLRWSPDGKSVAAFGYKKREDLGKLNQVFHISIKDKNVKQLTPDSEDKYKEGLAWHPDGKRLTYMYYGPGETDAQIRWAYPDGRPTELFIEQEDHWDYVGRWDPEGRLYYFFSFINSNNELDLHVKDLETGEIRHGLHDGWLPRWNREGTVMVWSSETPNHHFESFKGIR